MKKIIFAMVITLAVLVSCNNAFVTEILPDRSNRQQQKAYIIVIGISGNISGDKVTASPNSGDDGDIITLSYTVANTAHYNLLDLGGVTDAIAPVDSAGSGTRTYVTNAADASNGVITITAIFEHIDLESDPIAFSDTEGHISKTYGDVPFTNAVTAEHSGSGAVTYSSSDTSVATVDSSGKVTIHKVGSTVITAEKEADAVYAYAQKDYTLAVNPKPVTITGLSVANKLYDGTTTATVTGTAAISGKIVGDDVSVVTGTAAFESATVGNSKAVIFSGWSLTGADAGNYTLLAQPSVTANINGMIEMVWINAGTFVMGSPAGEPNHNSNETQHSVTLTQGFYMGKYQVTQAQYQAVTSTNPSYFTTANGRAPADGESDEKRPVEYVTWYDAIEFCNKISAIEGLEEVYTISGRMPTSGYPITSATVTADFTKNGYRLPTEAQWEYACRAGTTTAYNTGATISDSTGWYTGNSGSKTHEVGLKPANKWGLYDMHGNVREWCWDLYYWDYYSSSPANDPLGASVYGAGHVNRGGGWSSAAGNLRSAFRNVNDSDLQSVGLGFRLVRP